MLLVSGILVSLAVVEAPQSITLGQHVRAHSPAMGELYLYLGKVASVDCSPQFVSQTKPDPDVCSLPSGLLAFEFRTHCNGHAPPMHMRTGHSVGFGVGFALGGPSAH